MWRIEKHRRIDKQLSGSVPIEILKRYEKWKDIAMLSGLQGLRIIKGFHDEALSGEWQGYRSSRLGLQWRVIYRYGSIQRGAEFKKITDFRATTSPLFPVAHSYPFAWHVRLTSLK